jgi:hypothetical protein
MTKRSTSMLFADQSVEVGMLNSRPEQASEKYAV